jgi:hypothetical protein
MAIQVSTDPTTGERTATFSMPATFEQPDTIVSVVGSFNDWMPGVHVFVADDDGQLTVSVPLMSDDDLHFRYLQTGGVWFDDPDADEATAHGSVVRVDRAAPSSAAGPTERASLTAKAVDGI